MSEQPTRMLIVKLPAELKYRLDRVVLEEGTTIRNKVTEILTENLPLYAKTE